MNKKYLLCSLVASFPLAALAGTAEVSSEHQHAAPPHVGRGNHTRIYVEIPPQGLEDYVRDADEIVRGIVTGQRVVFPQIGLAYTEVDLWALSAVKGSSGRMMRLRIAGARSDERNVEVHGAPRFIDGEEVLLFLMRFIDRQDGREYHGIRGLGHGAYRMPLAPSSGPTVTGLHAAGERDLVEFERRIAALHARHQKEGAK